MEHVSYFRCTKTYKHIMYLYKQAMHVTGYSGNSNAVLYIITV